MLKILLITLLPIIGFSQVPVKDGHILYEFTDSIPLTKAQLHLKAEQFFANEFRSSKAVLQLDDKESGELIGKGIIVLISKSIIGPVGNDFRVTIKVSSREGKYRVQFYDFIYIQPMSYVETNQDERVDKKSFQKSVAGPMNDAVNDVYLRFRKSLTSTDSF